MKEIIVEVSKKTLRRLKAVERKYGIRPETVLAIGLDQTFPDPPKPTLIPLTRRKK